MSTLRAARSDVTSQREGEGVREGERAREGGRGREAVGGEGGRQGGRQRERNRGRCESSDELRSVSINKWGARQGLGGSFDTTVAG